MRSALQPCTLLPTPGLDPSLLRTATGALADGVCANSFNPMTFIKPALHASPKQVRESVTLGWAASAPPCHVASTPLPNHSCGPVPQVQEQRAAKTCTPPPLPPARSSTTRTVGLGLEVLRTAGACIPPPTHTRTKAKQQGQPPGAPASPDERGLRTLTPQAQASGVVQPLASQLQRFAPTSMLPSTPLSLATMSKQQST